MKWVVGNWKMHTTAQEAKLLARRLREELYEPELPRRVRVIVCPPFTSLCSVQEALRGSWLQWGHRTATRSWRELHGEISVRMLTALGCSAVIVGIRSGAGLPARAPSESLASSGALCKRGCGQSCA
jgi:triosephosphate isomerase